jgi:hypothetical protein
MKNERQLLGGYRHNHPIFVGVLNIGMSRFFDARTQPQQVDLSLIETPQGISEGDIIDFEPLSDAHSDESVESSSEQAA